MKIAITGATGFLGNHLVRLLIANGHRCRCWYRPTSNLGCLFDVVSQIEWVEGQLAGNRDEADRLLGDCDALVHSALDRPGREFRGGEGDLETFATNNLVGSLRLFEAARRAKVRRVIFVSTCAVYGKVLSDRLLDEGHPLWPDSHYGAHKAAVEAFIHSYGSDVDFSIFAIRPCGIYGVARPVDHTRWYQIVKAIAHGEPVNCRGGAKLVHVSDVARAIELLLNADDVGGQAFNCCDQHVSEWGVASTARKICQSDSLISGSDWTPKHQIATTRLQQLGMEFGGDRLVTETLSQLIDKIKELDGNR